MSALVPDRYIEMTSRLALGIEPIDAARGVRLGHAVMLTLDGLPLFRPKPPFERMASFERHRSCLHALRFQPGIATTVDVRVFDGPDGRFSNIQDGLYEPESDGRRVTPRRLSIPIPSSGTADAQPYTNRVRQIGLFPGAAYDVPESATGLRGRVTRGGKPMRWARARAVNATGDIVGHAHGDDRGEFLLLLDPRAAGVGDLQDPLTLDISIFGPVTPPQVPAANQDLPSLDPLWDLPLEVAPAPGLSDTVSPGFSLPAGYQNLLTRAVQFPVGRLRGGEPIFAI